MKLNNAAHLIIAIFFLFLGGYIGYDIGQYSLRPHPPTITTIRVESTVQGTVIATEWDGKTTTVRLRKGGSFTIDGFVALAIPGYYEFQFYDGSWHVYNMIDGTEAKP
jgi:hypothetical protein